MKTPKDGYYMAEVQLDTGGERTMYVRVGDGKTLDEWGRELLPEACSEFREVSTSIVVQVWPAVAAMELDALRTANKALVERVKRLEHYVERLHSAGNELRDGSGDDDAIYRWRAVKRDNPLHQEHKP